MSLVAVEIVAVTAVAVRYIVSSVSLHISKSVT